MQLNENIHQLGFGHMGNGITVWMSDGKCPTVAHINRNRQVTYHKEKLLTELHLKEIEHYARTADPCVSASQDAKVFDQRPAAQ